MTDGRSESGSHTSWLFAKKSLMMRATLSFHQSVFHPPLELTRTPLSIRRTSRYVVYIRVGQYNYHLIACDRDDPLANCCSL